MIRIPDKMEKRIDFIEPIFDLMYVFLLRCTAQILHPAGSFFTVEDFVNYTISVLVVLLIWTTTTTYINRFAKGKMGDYVLLFSNLYFLYYIGVNSQTDWISHFAAYHAAWALILVNFLIQYVRLQMLDENKTAPMRRFLRSREILLLVEIVLVLVTIPLDPAVQRLTAWIPLAVGFVGPALFTRKIDAAVPLDLPHLSERVQGLVLIAFGEVIISIAGYFRAELTPRNICFSLCAFLTIVGLLMSYGYMYLHMIDHNRSGRAYMLMCQHMIVIILLGWLSVSFDITLKPDHDRWANHVFMTVTMLTYYFVLCLITKVAGKPAARKRWLPKSAVLLSAGYAVIMLQSSLEDWVSAASTVLYSFLMLICLILHWHSDRKSGCADAA